MGTIIAPSELRNNFFFFFELTLYYVYGVQIYGVRSTKLEGSPNLDHPGTRAVITSGDRDLLLLCNRECLPRLPPHDLPKEATSNSYMAGLCRGLREDY